MNIIDAIIFLVQNPIVDLQEVNGNKNMMNSMGKSLENYIGDLFAGTLDIDDNNKRMNTWERVFSYQGNNNNPPDIMLRGGDAIEVKKIEANNSAIALNSSYPKQKLFATSSMISTSCRNAESWIEKDIIYAVGVVSGVKLKHLCFVYGLDYAASRETYTRIKKRIKAGVDNIPGIEFAETRELGRINRVDPLGITYLRVRGMWGIENPWSVFNYIVNRDTTKDFNFMCIINNEKWNSFPNTHELEELVKSVNGLSIEKVMIKNPDNPVQLRSARLIKFVI